MSVISNLRKITNARGNYLIAHSRLSTSNAVYHPKMSLEEKLGIKPKPKRPLTPYFKFASEIRPETLKHNQDKPITEISKIISEKWKNLDQTKKDKLHNDYKVEYVKYQELCKNYEQSLSMSDKEELMKAKLNIKLDKQKRLVKKKKVDLGCPKRPPSSFVLFTQEKASERGDMVFKDWRTKLSQMWENLPDSEKEKYTQRYKTEMEEYKRRFAAWEEDMKKKGNLDVKEEKQTLDKSRNEESLEKKEERTETTRVETKVKNKLKIFIISVLTIISYLSYIQM